jgi:uncharacterized protein DUF1707/cell wall-active antibiotic response 4TMS protein YvqF
MDGQDLVRVSDAEREAVVERLNAATSEGRLTLEEFGDRVAEALAARTRGDLNRVVVDLPAPAAGPMIARSSAIGAPASTVPSPARTSEITPVGSVKRGGRWRIDRDMELGTIVGSVKLDLRQAEIGGAEIALHVKTVVGSVKVWIPYGIAVEVSGESVLGSRSVDEDSPGPYAPVLRLRIDTVMGSVKVYRV